MSINPDIHYAPNLMAIKHENSENKSFFSTSKLPRIPKTSETLLHIMDSDGMERERERDMLRWKWKKGRRKEKHSEKFKIRF